MPDLSITNLLLFAGFVLPGAVSLQVYRLLVSLPDSSLKENIIEAIVFSFVNFALIYWLVLIALDDHFFEYYPLYSYGLLILCFFIFPVIWPFLLVSILKKMENLKIIQPRAKTAWDHYFNTLPRGSYVIIHMKDNSYIGGKFGMKSFASGYPHSGEIFLEELWEVDDTGQFTGECYSNQGVIITSDEYKFVRVSVPGE